MNILLIAPYQNLITAASSVTATYPYEVKVALGNLATGLEAAQHAIETSHPDIIISRGGTATLLKQNLDIPVFEIEVSAYDLLRAIHTHLSQEKRIAVIGYENVITGAKSIAQIMGIDLGFFPVTPFSNIREVVTEAQKWGADVIVGDTISVNTAKRKHIETELIQSGPEAIQYSLDSAVQFYQHMQEEILRVKRLNSIMEHTEWGMLYIDPKGSINMVNSKAEHILDIPRKRLVGEDVTSSLLPKSLFSCYKARTGNKVIQIQGRDYIVECSAIHAGESEPATLIYLQSVGHIRNLEGIIRKQMINRGLIASHTFDSVIAFNGEFKKLIEKARRYSETDSTMLLLGETGAGKEIFAQSVHNNSPRRSGPFVAVNCAALPDTLLESELFGYVEGAFTGAKKGGKTGLFELAHRGTIFLDEVNDMSPVVQARFLRVLQEKQVMRLGDDKIYDIDVRVIAACNKDLFEETELGRFRKDLYYRLKILDVHIPPLRDRTEDIVPLFTTFLDSFTETYSYPKEPVPERLLEALRTYSWPGNVRQLKNFAEKVSVLFTFSANRTEIVQDLIEELSDLKKHNPGNGAGKDIQQNSAKTLKEIEAQIMCDCWKKHDRNISKAAKELGIDRVTLRNRLKEFDLYQ